MNGPSRSNAIATNVVGYAPPLEDYNKAEPPHLNDRAPGVAGPVSKVEDCKENDSVLSLFVSPSAQLAFPKKKGLINVFLRPFATCDVEGPLSDEDDEIMFFQDSALSMDYSEASRGTTIVEEDDVLEEMKIITRMSSLQSQHPGASLSPPTVGSLSPTPPQQQARAKVSELPSSLRRKSNDRDIGTKKKRASVAFHDPPVSSLRQYPVVKQEDIPKLFFSEEELRLAELDRKEGRAADDVECVHMSAEEWHHTMSVKKFSSSGDSTRRPNLQKSVLDRIRGQTGAKRELWSASPMLRRNRSPDPRGRSIKSRPPTPIVLEESDPRGHSILNRPPAPIVLDESKLKTSKSLGSRLRQLVGRPPKPTQNGSTHLAAKKTRRGILPKLQAQAQQPDDGSKTVVFLRSRSKADSVANDD